LNDSKEASHASPAIINPTAVYTIATARAALGLAENTLPRECRLGRLRCSKRAGKILILGAWLLQWIEGGEVKRRHRARTNGTATAD
jgi:hypothetical protein